MADHNKLGNIGEELAVKFLVAQGYNILEKSWRFKHKEVDIIATDSQTLVFVEVKTRTSNYWGNPEEFVTKQKQRFLISAAEEYILQSDFDGDSRFDIISIIVGEEEPQIEHIVEAYYP